MKSKHDQRKDDGEKLPIVAYRFSKCFYSDGEVETVDKHIFDKNGFCSICGKTKEQSKF